MDMLLGFLFFAGLIYSGLILVKYTWKKAEWYEGATLVLTSAFLILFIIGSLSGE